MRSGKDRAMRTLVVNAVSSRFTLRPLDGENELLAQNDQPSPQRCAGEGVPNTALLAVPASSASARFASC
jgi:hypothetical protein